MFNTLEYIILYLVLIFGISQVVKYLLSAIYQVLCARVHLPLCDRDSSEHAAKQNKADSSDRRYRPR